jgi:hypothetical protein
MAWESKETAAFNLALPYLNRVNSILNSNYVEFKNGNQRAFAINLKQLYRELEPWLIVKKSEKVDEKTPIQNAFKELSAIPRTDSETIWEKMEEIEMMMRDRFKQLGMLMPKLTDPRFLFGNKQK